MLKKLTAILVLFVVLAIYITVSDEQTAEKTATQSAQSNEPTVPGVAGEREAQGNRKQPKWHPPSWHRIIAWPDGVTAWGLLLTLWFIAMQAEETAKAAEATEKAARASLKQARHAVTSDRAWLVIRSSMEGFVPREGEKWVYWWQIENTGNTPARILETQCLYEVVGRRDLALRMRLS